MVLHFELEIVLPAFDIGGRNADMGVIKPGVPLLVPSGSSTPYL